MCTHNVLLVQIQQCTCPGHFTYVLHQVVALHQACTGGKEWGSIRVITIYGKHDLIRNNNTQVRKIRIADLHFPCGEKLPTSSKIICKDVRKSMSELQR